MGVLLNKSLWKQAKDDVVKVVEQGIRERQGGKTAFMRDPINEYQSKGEEY